MSVTKKIKINEANYRFIRKIASRVNAKPYIKLNGKYIHISSYKKPQIQYICCMIAIYAPTQNEVLERERERRGHALPPSFFK